uniref:Uncharacterized protein n=1 Tax=Manihot esculenta TaxID=3983 RepID=A0A2C9UWL0_MANES
MEKLWNEVAVLRPLPVCECRAFKLFMDRENDDESYDHTINQILTLDPLPIMNKVYSMVLRVEKQREVNVINTDFDDSAL